MMRGAAAHTNRAHASRSRTLSAPAAAGPAASRKNAQKASMRPDSACRIPSSAHAVRGSPDQVLECAGVLLNPSVSCEGKRPQLAGWRAPSGRVPAETKIASRLADVKAEHLKHMLNTGPPLSKSPIFHMSMQKACRELAG